MGDGYETTTLSLIEMTGEIWDDSQYEESGGLSTRLLAEHFAAETDAKYKEMRAEAVIKKF